MSTNLAIGIDIGTTYSCVSVFLDGKVNIIENEHGDRKTPSYVSYDAQSSSFLVGELAKNQMLRNLDNTIYNMKSLVGRNFNDEIVQKEIKFFPFLLYGETNTSKIIVKLDGKATNCYLEEILAVLIEKMKKTAELYLGASVTSAVITVPSYFNYLQRQATQNAAYLAGLKVLRILNDTSSAALAYGLNKKFSKQNVLIFDLGGGNLNLSVLTIDEDIYVVKSIGGNTSLGGQDFDNRLIEYFNEEFKVKYNKDIMKRSKKALQRLRLECERVKRVLSTNLQARIEIDAFHDGIDFYTSISRTRFEELNDDLFKKTIELVEKSLIDAKLDKSEINEIVLVGGSTRIPKIQQLLSEFFNGKPLNKTVNADEAVAYGAAIQAAIINGTHKLSEDTQRLFLLDVVPFSLGIESPSGEMVKLINCNTTIPAIESKVYTTSIDNQNSVFIQVFEGNDKLCRNNTFLGRFELNGLPPVPSGLPQIEIKFDVDAYGLLRVSALEKLTNKKAEIVINKDRLFIDRLNKIKSLEMYCNSVKQTFSVDHLANRMCIHKRKAAIYNCDATLIWLITINKETVELNEIEIKMKELESICSPLIIKLYNDFGYFNQPFPRNTLENTTFF